MGKSQICMYNNTGLVHWDIKLEGEDILVSDKYGKFDLKIKKDSTSYEKLNKYLNNYLDIKHVLSLMNEKGLAIYFDSEITPTFNTGILDFKNHDGVLAFLSFDVTTKSLIDLKNSRDVVLLHYDFITIEDKKILNMCVYFRNKSADTSMLFTYYDNENKEFTRNILRFKKESVLILAKRDIDKKEKKTLDKKGRASLYRAIPNMLSTNVVCLKNDIERLRKSLYYDNNKIFAVKKYKDLNVIKGLKCVTVYDPDNEFDKEMVNYMKTLVNRLYICKSRGVYRLK